MTVALQGKVVLVLGFGGEAHRAVAVALAEAGADIAVCGATAGTLSDEAALNSIANEIWALGRRSAVVTLDQDTDPPFTEAHSIARAELGSTDLLVQVSEL